MRPASRTSSREIFRSATVRSKLVLKLEGSGSLVGQIMNEMMAEAASIIMQEMQTRLIGGIGVPRRAFWQPRWWLGTGTASTFAPRLGDRSAPRTVRRAALVGKARSCSTSAATNCRRRTPAVTHVFVSHTRTWTTLSGFDQVLRLFPEPRQGAVLFGPEWNPVTCVAGSSRATSGTSPTTTRSCSTTR